MHWRRWSAKDQEQLVSLRNKGETFRAIGEKLSRTPLACKAKHDILVRLGIASRQSEYDLSSVVLSEDEFYCELFPCCDCPDKCDMNLERTNWTRYQSAQLVAMYNDGESYEDISLLVGRSPASCNRRIQYLRKNGAIPPYKDAPTYHLRHWTEAETKTLITMYNSGKTYTDIGKVIGKSRASCNYKALSLKRHGSL